MGNSKKNIVDKFLDSVGQPSNTEYVKTYVKPSRAKCLLYFSFSLLLLVIIVLGFMSLSVPFFLLLIFDLLICVYYGYNLFSKKGLAIRKFVKVNRKENPDDEEEVEHRD